MIANNQALICMKPPIALVALMVGCAAASAAGPAANSNDTLALSLREAQATQVIFEKQACALKHPELAQTMQTLLSPAMDIVFGKGPPAAKGYAAADARFRQDLQKIIDQWRANNTPIDPSLTVENCKKLPVALDLTPDVLARQRSFFESEIGLLTGYKNVCAEAFPNQALQMTPLLQGFIKTVLGDTPQTEQKLATLLARPDMQALMQNNETRARSDQSKNTARFAAECLQR